MWQLGDVIASFAPDAVLSFGVSFLTDTLRLERIAVNIDDAEYPDSDGNRRSGQKISKEGPVGYWTTVPLSVMHQALADADIPARISNYAGTYV